MYPALHLAGGTCKLPVDGFGPAPNGVLDPCNKHPKAFTWNLGSCSHPHQARCNTDAQTVLLGNLGGRARGIATRGGAMATYSAPRQGTKDVDTLGIEPRAFRMRSGCDTTTPCALCTEGNQAKLVVQKMSAMTKPVGQRSPSVWMRWMATTETGGTANKASSRIALIAF